ncbi:hypothetical protein F4823DRAFT_620783 [Ustulina deusta]|nr:hypothetical protein F4823DRAFT_620783 [Ustulina deusta]
MDIALVKAIEYRQTEITKFLVSKGADVNANVDATSFYVSYPAVAPLEIAVSLGDMEMTQFLVQAGADVNMHYRYASSGAGSALAACRDVDIAEFLVEKGADVNMHVPSGKYGSALVAAVFGIYRGGTEMCMGVTAVPS